MGGTPHVEPDASSPKISSSRIPRRVEHAEIVAFRDLRVHDHHVLGGGSQNAWTGVTQRRHSSTPPGTSDVSETRAARWSGCSCSTAAVPDSKVRVVSFPATSSVRRNMNSSSLLSGHPATSLPTRSETRSSPGRSRFDRMCATINPESSPSAAMVSSGGRSGDSMAASDQPRKSSRSDSSIPSNSTITVSGKGAASSATKSISSRGSTASSSVEALARMESVRPAMAEHEPSVDQPTEGGVLGRVHVQDRATLHRRPARTERVIDQRTASGAEVTRVTAQVPDVLVAADGPESRRALVHRILGTELGQHVVVVVPEEEGGVTRVDLAPLVLEHGPSVLCRAERAEYENARSAAHLQPSSAEADSRRASRMSPIGFSRRRGAPVMRWWRSLMARARTSAKTSCQARSRTSYPLRRS